MPHISPYFGRVYIAAKAFPIESAMLSQAERDLFAINSSRFYRSKENSEALARPTNLIRAEYYV